MRKVLVTVFCLLVASSAFAGTITSINPSSVKVNSGEHFITVNGTALGNTLVFTGGGGTFERAISASFSGRVVGWVPEQVISKSGTYSLAVRDANGGLSNAVNFTVVGFKFFPLAVLTPEILFEQAKSREGAFVRYDVFASGGEDPNPVVKCDQESGAFYRYGVTTVTCEASNSFGERATAKFDIVVGDRLGPVVTVPKDIRVPARSNEGSPVEWDGVKAVDEIYGEMQVDCSPRSGSNFRIGRHTVICTSTDPEGNLGSAAFGVEVTSDRQPPSLTLVLPQQIHVVAKDPRGVEVGYEVSVKGTKDPNPSINCFPKSGSLFALGLTTVNCDVVEQEGGWAVGSFDVFVLDGNAPEIRFISASPDRLPNDNRMWPVTLKVDAVDDLDLQPVCSIIGVTSNENIYADDDPKSTADFNILGPLALELRGEMTRGTRAYNVWVGCTDFFGNMGQAYTQVLVTSAAGANGSGNPRRRAGGK
jgi:HYR domain